MEGNRISSLEKRKFPRLKDKVFIFGNLRLNPIEEFKALTKDISAGGLMFGTERDIHKGCQLEIEVYHPINRDKIIIFSVPVLAKVVWIREIEKDNFEEGENRYKIGVQFTEIKEEDRKIIATYIQTRTSEK